MRNENGEIVWNRKLLGLIGGSIGVLLVLGTSFFTHEVDLGASQTHQNDLLANHTESISELKAIAKINSEARIRVDVELIAINEKLKVVQSQHDEMERQLTGIQDLLAKHERETRKQLRERNGP